MMLVTQVDSQVFGWPDRDSFGSVWTVCSCKHCIVSKTAEHAKRVPLESITYTRPLQLICIDFQLAGVCKQQNGRCNGGDQSFYKNGPGISLTAKWVPKVLWDKFSCVFGFPERIHNDQEASFNSQLISELLRVSGIRKPTLIILWATGVWNSLTETLSNMICVMTPDMKANWPRR